MHFKRPFSTVQSAHRQLHTRRCVPSSKAPAGDLVPSGSFQAYFIEALAKKERKKKRSLGKKKRHTYTIFALFHALSTPYYRV
jgi:hypothetical protein